MNVWCRHNLHTLVGERQQLRLRICLCDNQLLAHVVAWNFILVDAQLFPFSDVLLFDLLVCRRTWFVTAWLHASRQVCFVLNSLLPCIVNQKLCIRNRAPLRVWKRACFKGRTFSRHFRCHVSCLLMSCMYFALNRGQLKEDAMKRTETAKLARRVGLPNKSTKPTIEIYRPPGESPNCLFVYSKRRQKKTIDIVAGDPFLSSILHSTLKSHRYDSLNSAKWHHTLALLL